MEKRLLYLYNVVSAVAGILLLILIYFLTPFNVTIVTMSIIASCLILFNAVVNTVIIRLMYLFSK